MCEIPTLFTDSGQKNVCMKYDKEATSSTSVDGEILGAVIQKVTNHKRLFLILAQHSFTVIIISTILSVFQRHNFISYLNL